MSDLRIQGLGRFTAYADPARASNGVQEDLTSVSQVKKPDDPFGLREICGHRPDVINVLDKIDEALANFNPGEGRYLDLHGIDFRSLNHFKVANYERLNLETLLKILSQKSQYPFYRANLSEANFRLADLAGANFEQANLAGANLTEAWLERASFEGANLTDAFAVVNDERLTGNALRDYLVSKFNVRI